MNNTNTATPPLTQQEASQIAEAYTRFHELRNVAIATPTTDAEIKGLSEFLANQFINHAGEFIGCWFAVRNEYEPILGLIARVAQRISGINAMNNRPPVAQTEAKNIVTLGK